MKLWKKNLHIGAVFVDLQKAFHTVNHELLMLLLHDLGIGSKCNEIIKSYLSIRKICSTGFNSSWTFAVYFLYISNIQDVKFKSDYKIYTNDIVLIYSGKNK